MLDRIRTKKKTGGQPGHERQQILPTKDVRQVIPEQCSNCQAPLRGKDPKPSFHQQIEIPPVKPTVTPILVLQVKPERPSTHPGRVLINSGGLLNSLYPFMPEIP